MIKFLEPYALLLLIPTTLYIYVIHRKIHLRRALLSKAYIVDTLKNSSRWYKTLLLIKIVLYLLIPIVIARPAIVTYSYIGIDSVNDVITYNNELPITHIILIDVSKSMSYREVLVDRLSLAKKFIEKYLSHLGSRDNVVIISFAKETSVLCQGNKTVCIGKLSQLREFKEYSAIGDAIVYGLNYARASSLPSVIVVVSDGAWNYGSNPIHVVSNLNKSKTPLAFIRVGTDPRANKLIQFLKERNFMVYSVGEVNEEVLDTIIKEAYSEIKLTTLKYSGKSYILYEELDYRLFYLLILILLVLSLMYLLEGIYNV